MNEIKNTNNLSRSVSINLKMQTKEHFCETLEEAYENCHDDCIEVHILVSDVKEFLQFRDLTGRNILYRFGFKARSSNTCMRIFKSLIQMGVDKNDVDPRTGLTLMHTLAFAGDLYFDSIKILLESGANPHIKVVDVGEVLDVANLVGGKKVIQLLKCY
jgi:ankyrin repeat protein